MDDKNDPRGFNFDSPSSETSSSSRPPLSSSSNEAASPSSGGSSTRENDASREPWGWTQQYTSRPSRISSPASEAKSSEASTGAPTAGGNADLAAMYVSPEKVKSAHDSRLTFTKPHPTSYYFPWKWTLIALLLFVVGGVIGMAFITVDTKQKDTRGQTIRISALLLVWYKVSGQNPHPVATESDAYHSTKNLIQEVHAAAIDYERKKGKYPPSVKALLEAGFISADAALDGWGNEFLFIEGAETIVSPGSDGKVDTSDDIRYGPGGLKIPSDYQAYDIE